MRSLLSWGGLSAVLIAVSGLLYMRAIIRGTVPRPVISTWGIWAGLGLLLLIAYSKAENNETTIWAAWMGFINPLIIFILALKYGEYRWDRRIDTSCVAICIITVAIWQLTESALLGLLGGLIADACGLYPQWRATRKAPQDESLLAWSLFCFGSAVNLLGIQQWNLGTATFPLYMTIGSALIVYPILFHRLRSLKRVGA